MFFDLLTHVFVPVIQDIKGVLPQVAGGRCGFSKDDGEAGHDEHSKEPVGQQVQNCFAAPRGSKSWAYKQGKGIRLAGKRQQLFSEIFAG
jgi:hypothetical protein